MRCQPQVKGSPGSTRSSADLRKWVRVHAWMRYGILSGFVVQVPLSTSARFSCPQNPLCRNGFLTTLSNNPSTTSSSPRKELKVHISHVFVYNIPAKISSSICWLMAHCLHTPALSCGRNSGNILVFLWQSRVAASAGRKYINQDKHHKIHYVFAGRHSEPANFI